MPSPCDASIMITTSLRHGKLAGGSVAGDVVGVVGVLPVGFGVVDGVFVGGDPEPVYGLAVVDMLKPI